MNTLTLQRHTQLLEVLEMPQLMDTCVRNGYYEEALELAAHVRRLEKKHSTIPVLMSIVEEVKSSTQLMLSQLIQQLRTNLQLPACLRVIGYLRRMEVFTEPELRIKFLQARDSWFQSILDAIPRDDPYTHITKTIEASRVHLFDIMTQFRAIFSDEDPILSSMHEDIMPESSLFHSWVVQKVSQFLTTLEQDLERGIGGRLDSLLGQCMYFGLSFSRVGADFRGLVAPIFQRAALRYFEEALKEANKKFEENMQSYNLLGLTTSGGLNYGASQAGQLYPPTVLLDFYPLAAYCNHVLTAFNDLRLCAPINLACQVAEALTRSLQEVNRIILAFHRAEETTFNQKEQAQFEQFCATYAADLLPYLNRCLQALFPTSQLSLMLGVSTSEIGRMGNIGLVDLPLILSQVDHLILKVEEETLLLNHLHSPPHYLNLNHLYCQPHSLSQNHLYCQPQSLKMNHLNCLPHSLKMNHLNCLPHCLNHQTSLHQSKQHRTLFWNQLPQKLKPHKLVFRRQRPTLYLKLSLLLQVSLENGQVGNRHKDNVCQ
ncbi:hypothetical protein C0Q70_12895 [Pomacea canaliculata]|uniref:Conserved oligomeric Golgi complex subunit 8 n=1 Tax=Pomacea canaliculata TaxID=400727 RepID=A0A2T7P2T0_POMCA|nr:hypothetical protein C0Q70_12895 [Pomacea canaliculata]